MGLSCTMKKYIQLVFLGLLLSFSTVSGQSEPQISQYMFCMETYNPAIIGSYSEINLFGLFRQQWVGIPNAPQTLYFSANSPVSLSGDKYGVGLQFLKDDAGIFSNQSVNLQLSRKLRLYDGDFYLGSNLGFVSQTIHGDSVRQITSDYHDISGDVSIPSQSVSDMALDLSVGVYYSYKKLNLGVSFLHLSAPELQMDDYVKSYISRMVYLTGSYQLPLPNSRYVFKPTVLFKSDFVSFQTDISGFVEKDERYWAGLSWRYQDAIVFFIGMNFLQGVRAGYSFDLSTNKIISNSKGSHELFLRYSFGLGRKKSNNYKSVRIL